MEALRESVRIATASIRGGSKASRGLYSENGSYSRIGNRNPSHSSSVESIPTCHINSSNPSDDVIPETNFEEFAQQDDDATPETYEEFAQEDETDSEMDHSNNVHDSDVEFVPSLSMDEIYSMPLPPLALLDQESRMENTKKVMDFWKENRALFVNRYESAKAERKRHTNLEKPPKKGRSGNDASTKKPPKGKRVVLKWNVNGLPIGEWGDHFNKYLGCLAKRFDLFNVAMGWLYQPFRLMVVVWLDLLKYFVMDENPNGWKYVFHIKIESMLGGWKSRLRTHFFKFNQDWERFWRLDPRVDGVQFAACAYYWETDASKIKSKKCSESRLKIPFDHHLCSSSFVVAEDRMKKKLKVEYLTAEQKVQISYGTFGKEYKNEMKKRKNLLMVEDVSLTLKETAIRLQGPENPDISKLPPDVQDKCLNKVMGTPKKNHTRLKGTKVMRKAKGDGNSSTSSKRLGKRIQAEPTIESVIEKCDKLEVHNRNLEVRNQVFMDFFFELHPDKVGILKEHLESATTDSNNRHIQQESPSNPNGNEQQGRIYAEDLYYGYT